MLANAILVTPKDAELARVASAADLHIVATWSIADLAAPETQRQGALPELLLFDVRGQSGLPRELDTYTRRHPDTAVIVVASRLDVDLLRDAMRMGVGECVAEPITSAELRAAVTRVVDADASSVSYGKVFAFTAAKGGSGATTVAVNVAAALAAGPDPSVVFLDLHTQEPGNAALCFGVEPRYSVIDAIDNLSRLDAAFMRGLVTRAASNVDVIAAPAEPPAHPPAPAAIHALLHWLVTQYRYVVIDMPRLGADALDAVEPMTMATVVLTQELAAVRGGVSMVSLLRQRYSRHRVSVVINRYDSRADIAREDIERLLGLPVSAMLPSDYPATVSAANAGQPLITDRRNKLSKALVALSESLRRASPDSAAAGWPRGVSTPVAAVLR